MTEQRKRWNTVLRLPRRARRGKQCITSPAIIADVLQKKGGSIVDTALEIGADYDSLHDFIMQDDGLKAIVRSERDRAMAGVSGALGTGDGGGAHGD